MTLMQRDREMKEEGREEGKEEGREEGREESVRIIKLYNKGYKIIDIADKLKIDIATVESIITKFND